MGSVSPHNIQGSIATPLEGYEFVNWIDEKGNEVSIDLELIPEKEAGTYYAVFEKTTEEEEKPGEEPGDNGNEDETPPTNGDNEKPIEEDPTPTPDPIPEPTPEPEPEQLIPEMGDGGLVKFGIVGVVLGALFLVLSKKED